MKRVVILTGSELRHQFFRKLVAATPGIEVPATICEGTEKALSTLAQAKQTGTASLEIKHINARTQSEEDFFRLFDTYIADQSHPHFVPKGEVNDQSVFEKIDALNPDLLVAYGCSIIGGPLLERFPSRFLNVHLGLSPYYRGSGTNFWPFVNGEPEYCGLTFMHIDAGVDTGEIIHQVRPRITAGDTIHSIGNRLIGDMARIYAQIILRFDELQSVAQPSTPPSDKVYKIRDFTDAAVEKMYDRFEHGLIDDYLAEQDERCARVPLVENPILVSV